MNAFERSYSLSEILDDIDGFEFDGLQADDQDSMDREMYEEEEEEEGQ